MSDETITDFIRASRERITEITSDAADIWMQGSLKDLTLANYARTALPRALDIIEAQQKQLADLHMALSSQDELVCNQREKLAKQQAEIERVTALALACADWRHCDCFTEYDIKVICERCKMCAEIKGDDR